MDNSYPKKYSMVIARFLIFDKLGIIQFFEQTFLLADTNFDMILAMSFLVFLNMYIEFNTGSFSQMAYFEGKPLTLVW